MIWRVVIRSVLAMAAAIGTALPAQAQDSDDARLQSRIAEVIAVMQGKRAAHKTFDARFLAAVSADQLRALTQQLVRQGGKVEGYVDFKGEAGPAATFTLQFANASAPARIELGAGPRLVSGFRIYAITPKDDSLDKIDAGFAALPGKSGFAIYRLGSDGLKLVRGRAPETRFAIASTFKLYVLAALARQVKDGARRWSDVVAVSGKSFPGGTVHDWPEGAPVTLHTLASLMISISDNTATDMLMRVVGSEAIAREVRLSGHSDPAATLPLPTTAQIFALKRAGPSVTARYAAATPDQRAGLLAALDVKGVGQANAGDVFGSGPVAIDQAEWFASPTDVARVMDSLHRLGSPEALQILAIDPAMDETSRGRWAYIGYKGGSEDGVISQTWLLRDNQGQWSVVTGSWNNPEAVVDNERFELLMARLTRMAAF